MDNAKHHIAPSQETLASILTGKEFMPLCCASGLNGLVGWLQYAQDDTTCKGSGAAHA